MADLKIRRGTQSQLPTLGLGEPGFTTDTKRLYIGDGIGNNLIGPSDATSSGTTETLLDLNDTPSVYDDGKCLISTSVGIEWYNIADYYYTEPEVDTISGSLQSEIDGKADLVHAHDDLYYTESEIDTISGTLQNEIDTLEYLDLTDSPTTYSGEAGKLVMVNDEEDGLDFDFYEWDSLGPLIPETAISGTYFVNFEGGRLLIGATGGKPDLVYNGPVAGLAFDATKLEACYGVFKVPYVWNTASHINFTINFMTDADQTGIKTCAWDIDYHTYADGETYGSKTTSRAHVHIDSPNNAVAGTYIVATTHLCCIDDYNPIARGDMVAFKFYRDGADPEDDMVGDAILLSLMFELQVGQNTVTEG